MKNLITVLVIVFALTGYAQDQLYKVTLIRAAPGRLLDLIETIKDDIGNQKNLGIDKPYLMRHSQGDQWDLMIIYPVDKINILVADAKTLSRPYGDPYFEMVSFQEDAWVEGPEKKIFNEWFTQFGYYHVEIFTSLAGKQSELLKQRKMENVFLTDLNRRVNFIFTRVMGPSWDIFTIGFYDDIKAYAAAGDIDFETEDNAAKKAGFEGVNFIGSYLRSLILEHHDTLAGAVR
jgi:hypothetical protein